MVSSLLVPACILLVIVIILVIIVLSEKDNIVNGIIVFLISLMVAVATFITLYSQNGPKVEIRNEIIYLQLPEKGPGFYEIKEDGSLQLLKFEKLGK